MVGYSLYNTYLEGVGEFERYHCRIEGPVLYGDAVWSLADFAGWKGERLPGSSRCSRWFSRRPASPWTR